MRNLIFLALAAFMFPLLSSCKKDAELIPEERPYVRDFFVEGTLADYDGSDKAFDITVGKQVEAPFINLYTNQPMSNLDIRKHIESGFFGLSSSDPDFTFEFSQEGFAPPGAFRSWRLPE